MNYFLAQRTSSSTARSGGERRNGGGAVKLPQDSADKAAPCGWMQRLVRFFDSILRWIAQKNAPLGPIEFMLAVAVLVMSITVATMVCTICIKILIPSPSIPQDRLKQSERQAIQTEKGVQP